MADKAYIIPLRRDLDGVNILLTDLQPNSSQKNSSLDGEGQTRYLKWSLDAGSTTTVDGDAYVRGSTNTSPLPAASADDTTGGGNDVTATQEASFGLLSYLRERVHVNPGGNDDFMTSNEAATVAAALLLRLTSGLSLTVADVNTVLNDNLDGSDNSLDGTDGAGSPVAGSTSFGDIEELLRIMSGEVYRVPAYTILGDASGNWYPANDPSSASATDRDSLVAAQDSGSNGGITFSSQGGFLADGEAGFRDPLTVALSGPLRLSLSGGQLSQFAKQALVAINPNFAYTAAGVKPWKPRATTISGANIPESGSFQFCAVYDADGNLLT